METDSCTAGTDPSLAHGYGYGVPQVSLLRPGTRSASPNHHATFQSTERGWGGALSSLYGCRFSSFIFLHTNLVCPVLESITVLPGRQLQVTVLAFSCFVTMQCSMTSLFAGGSWLRTSGGVAATAGGVAATGCFFAAQPLKNKQRTRQPIFILIVFALCCHLVD